MLGWRLLKRGGLLLSLLLLLLMGLFLVADWLFPLPEIEHDPAPVILARDGTVLRHFPNREGRFRHYIALDEVSDEYLTALLLYEDRFFYHHFGMNPLATLRALGQWLYHGRIISGSSTLTMQTARLLYPHPRTLMGKGIQIFRALQLERRYSKEEILTLYINLAPMGGNIEGVAAASWRYFNKDPQAINLSEAALLVALPQRPSHYRPDRHPQKAVEARNRVLSRLYHHQQLDHKSYQLLLNDPLPYTPQATRRYTPHLSEQLRGQYPTQERITTTIDFTLQQQAEALVKRRSRHWAKGVSAAAMVLHNPTGEIYSYIGSVDLLDRHRFGFIDMNRAIRSPGSTLKPFVYGMALDRGIVHQASLLTDLPRSFQGYRPRNFDRKTTGAVPLYRALQRSLNIPAVQLFYHLTPEYFVERLTKGGVRLHHQGPPNLTLVLGGGGMTLIEQLRLYGALANNGVAPTLRYLLTEEVKKSSQPEPILSPGASWLITHILSQEYPIQYRTTAREIAWKTGTSYGYRDAWAFGVSPDWSIGLWIGRPDGAPNLGQLARDEALPLLFDLFALLPEDRATFQPPDTITPATICWPSGRQWNPNLSDEKQQCEQRHSIYTLAGKIPPTLYDAPGELPHTGWPLLIRQWQAQQEERPPLLEVTITTLPPESELFVTPTTPDLPLTATGHPPFYWYLNGVLLPDAYLPLRQLSEGRHQLSVQDRHHNSATLFFTITPTP